MKHIVFALFADTRAADAAIAGVLEADRSYREHVSLIVHSGAVDEAALGEAIQHSSGGEETDARHGRALGAMVGAATGAVLGVILAGPFGLLGGGPVAASLFGAGAGTLHGMLWSGIVGSGLTDHGLKKLTAGIQAGNVLVTVGTPDKAAEQRVEAILRQHGAAIAEKHTLG